MWATEHLERLLVFHQAGTATVPDGQPGIAVRATECLTERHDVPARGAHRDELGLACVYRMRLERHRVP